VAVGAEIKAELADNKTKRGRVEELSREGILISTFVYSPPPPPSTPGLRSVEEYEALAKATYNRPPIKTFIPWNSITSVQIVSPAKR
jgi:hypothetical protein